MAQPLNQQALSAPVIGATLAINQLPTHGVQVIEADQQRKRIMFGNPYGANTVIVCQPFDLNGNALAPTSANPGGGWPIVPYGILELTGDVGSNWFAVAVGGMNPLSIFSSRT
jgi:hypothetical protein